METTQFLVDDIQERNSKLTTRCATNLMALLQQNTFHRSAQKNHVKLIILECKQPTFKAYKEAYNRSKPINCPTNTILGNILKP